MVRQLQRLVTSSIVRQLKVLARSFITSDRFIEIDLPGQVIRADRGQGGRAGSRQAHDPASLAGGGLVQQPDGQPGVARWTAAFGLSQHDAGFMRGRRGEGETCFCCQGGEDGGEMARREPGKSMTAGKRAARAGLARSRAPSGRAWPARITARSSRTRSWTWVSNWYRARVICCPWPGRSYQACASVIIKTRREHARLLRLGAGRLPRACGGPGLRRLPRRPAQGTAVPGPGSPGRQPQPPGTCPSPGRR